MDHCAILRSLITRLLTSENLAQTRAVVTRVVARLFASEKNAMTCTMRVQLRHALHARIFCASFDLSCELREKSTAKKYFPFNERRRVSLIQISITISGVSISSLLLFLSKTLSTGRCSDAPYKISRQVAEELGRRVENQRH